MKYIIIALTFLFLGYFWAMSCYLPVIQEQKESLTELTKQYNETWLPYEKTQAFPTKQSRKAMTMRY